MPIRTRDDLLASDLPFTVEKIDGREGHIDAVVVLFDEDGLLRRSALPVRILPDIYCKGKSNETIFTIWGSPQTEDAPLERHWWSHPAAHRTAEYGMRGCDQATKYVLVPYDRASEIEFTRELPTWERKLLDEG